MLYGYYEDDFNKLWDLIDKSLDGNISGDDRERLEKLRCDYSICIEDQKENI